MFATLPLDTFICVRISWHLRVKWITDGYRTCTFCNPRLTSTYAPFGQASIPDELPAEAAAEAGGLALSMAAGDFVEVYGAQEQEGLFDCVATCFFIDTAHNIIRYMEVLRHCLKVGSLVLATDLGGHSMGCDANTLLNWASAAMSIAADCKRSNEHFATLA